MNRKKLIRNLISFLIIIVILIVGIFTLRYMKENRESETYHEYFEYNGKKYKEKDNLTLLLFAGLDSYENATEESYRNLSLADCLVLLVIDNEKGTILPVQINRDTMLEYNVLGIGGKIVESTVGQAALSHSYGTGGIDSLINTKDAVSGLFKNISIDYYVSLPMNAIGLINDRVGGVEVFVKDDFSNVDETLIMNEYITLNASQAMSFVRARRAMDDSSNIARMERQKEYLISLYEKCRTLIRKEKNFAYDTLVEIGEDLICNTNVNGLADIINTLVEDRLLESVSIIGEAVKGDEYMEFYVNETWLADFCIETFYEEIE